jgi:hypothetical protein
MLNFPDAPVVGQAFPPFIWDGVKWDRKKVGGGTPSTSLPVMSGIAAAGVVEEFARGDHAHPTDTSRAPVVNPAFTGGVTTDTLAITGGATIGAGLRAETGRIVMQMNDGGQPSAAVHSIGSTGGRGSARGFFVDTNNLMAFGSMDAAGNPLDNVARFDNVGHIWLNGIASIARDPTSPMEAATKQYVDAKGATGAYLPLAGGQMSGLLYPNYSPGSLTQAGGSGALEIQSGGGNDACMTFHRPGAFACHFGLASDHNFWYGGWSFGNVAWRLWSTRDFGAFPIYNMRMAYCADYNYPWNLGLTEPYGGTVITGGSGSDGVGNWTRRHRYWQVLTTGWWTVGYA